MILARIITFIVGVYIASRYFETTGTVITAIILAIILIQGQIMMDDQIDRMNNGGKYDD